MEGNCSIIKEEPLEIVDDWIAECIVTIYQCKFCHYNTQSKEYFVKHYKSHLEKNTDTLYQTKTTDEKFLCSLCYDVFMNNDQVREHMIKDHDCVPDKDEELPDSTSVNKHSNKESNASTNKRSDLQDDWIKPLSFKELKKKLKNSFVRRCSFKGCLYSFETSENCSYHEKCHMSTKPDKVKSFKCAECPKEATNWRSCSMHLWKEHQIDIDMLKCPCCSYRAGLSVQIFRHLQIHGTTRGFACSECPKTFKQFTQLRVHSITHIDKKADPKMRWYSQKKCDICGNMFSNSKILSKHIKTVHNKIKPFICSVCGHKSARKASWVIHMRAHTGEKPLFCKFCDFRAADPSVIKKHELRHVKSERVPYKCPDCKYTSIQSSNLKTHLKKYHPNTYKGVHCDQCSFVSINPDILKRHKQDHKSGVIQNEDSNDVGGNNGLTTDQKPDRTLSEKPNGNVEISSDCFLPIESTDSLAHEPPLDTGGVTIPAHSEETQFPCFINS